MAKKTKKPKSNQPVEIDLKKPYKEYSKEERTLWLLIQGCRHCGIALISDNRTRPFPIDDICPDCANNYRGELV